MNNIKMSKPVYAIEMNNVTKTFLNGKVVANDNVNLKVKKNEIHTIIGENGAGKSTLMSILFGVYSPDSGEIKINGRQVNFESASDATDAGLGMVHQHFKLIDEFTVWENVILGVEGVRRLSIIRQKEIKDRIQELIDRYNFKLNINKKVKELSVGQQQKIEILKLLYRNVDILIFDEPTAVLSEDEIKSFLEMILNFKKQGKTVIIITHKLSEIKSVADYGTVIRRGRYIDSFPISEKSVDEIAELMVGHKLTTVINTRISLKNSPIKFSVSNLNVYKQWKSNVIESTIFDKVKNLFSRSEKELAKTEEESNLVNFNIREGEIFAIAGVEGNGQSELALMLAGVIPTGKAEVILNDTNISKLSVNRRIKSGISSIPEDRHKHGLILDLPISKNTVLDQITSPEFSQFGFLKQNAINKHTINIIKKYDVRGTSRGTTNARLLSGGNQQKLIIGREMEKEHELLILVQPTRGMDLGAINFIHEQILNEKKNNKAILLISYELDEILTLADTVAVMQNGKFLKVESIENMSKAKIGQLMTGKE